VEFAKFAKERWNVTVRTSALAAGTPVAYGRIVEWKGRPEADIFWGGESALFDKLADQKLLARLELPAPVVDAIPVSVGKPSSSWRRRPPGLRPSRSPSSPGREIPIPPVRSSSSC
jgi:iron(III) transport system substrate-binding protein